MRRSSALRRGPLIGGAIACGGLLLGSASVEAAELRGLIMTPSYETFGLLITVEGASGNESLSVEYNAGSGTRTLHPPVRYDGRNWATSAFGLSPGSTGEVTVTLQDPDGVSGAPSMAIIATTRPWPGALSPNQTFFVAVGGSDQGSGTAAAPFATLQHAVDVAAPGDEIRVRPGTYAPIRIQDYAATADAPLVIRADTPANKPVIEGPGSGSGSVVDISGSSYIWLSGLEIRNGGDDTDGKGVRIHSSAHVIVEDCDIHDNGHYNLLVTKSADYPGGAELGGRHLIRNNHIYDSDAGNCAGASNQACPGQTYYGVQFDNNPGAASVVIGNRIHGNVDNVILCGNEAEGRALAALGDDVLVATGGTNLGFTNHDAELANNELYDARDDDLELDGICVNARVYGNVFRDAENPISMAPALPGPYFVLRNVIRGDWGQGAIKMNTNGDPESLTRNLYFYHNTIFREASGPLLNLWYDFPGEHSVPIDNIVFRNNLLVASAGGRLIDSYNQGSTHPSFDYDLWYTTDTQSVFTWYDGSATDRYDDLASFSQGTAQETNGLFAPPDVDSALSPNPSSPAVDSALVISGINDDYVGSAPDRGAYELGAMGGSPVGGSGGATSGGSANGGTGATTGGSANAGSGGNGSGGNDGVTGGSGGSGNDDAGCGCRTQSARRSGSQSWPLGFAIAWAIRRRRRLRRLRRR